MCILLVLSLLSVIIFSFFFNAPASSLISTLSLHDALPISSLPRFARPSAGSCACTLSRRSSSRRWCPSGDRPLTTRHRSEEHTSELQSRPHLVCRLLLEKKKQIKQSHHLSTIRWIAHDRPY